MPRATETAPAGAVATPVLWGPHTERCRALFAIGEQLMPLDVIHAMAAIKRAAAEVNGELGVLDGATALALSVAAQHVADGTFDDAFVLSVWQTGSGTHSHMNLNEVLATLASRELGRTVHAIDHVNAGQSSNDVFPSATSLAVLRRLPALVHELRGLQQTLQAHATAFRDIIKIGRTHLQDALPLSLGQEFSGYAAQLDHALDALQAARAPLRALPLGGTAVGTGLNSHAAFGTRVVQRLARWSGEPLVTSHNRFAAQAGLEACVVMHAALRLLAVSLVKIGSDIRLMGSGPRAGLGELLLPQNEAGSSMMPGKVNPTQVEALLMVCTQVMGHDVAIGFAASQGQFELNAFRPLVALNLLDSLRLLTDAIGSFHRHCVAGLAPDRARIATLLAHSLTPGTALTPHIGYDRSARIVQHAQAHGLSLREAALGIGGVSAHDFDAWVVPQQLAGAGDTP